MLDSGCATELVEILFLKNKVSERGPTLPIYINDMIKSLEKIDRAFKLMMFNPVVEKAEVEMIKAMIGERFFSIVVNVTTALKINEIDNVNKVIAL